MGLRRVLFKFILHGASPSLVHLKRVKVEEQRKRKEGKKTQEESTKDTPNVESKPGVSPLLSSATTSTIIL